VNPNIDWKATFGVQIKKRNRNGELPDASTSVPSDECRPIPLSSLGVDLSKKKKVVRYVTTKIWERSGDQ
jgi:hypothetical protein